jgi:hypothetical protein
VAENITQEFAKEIKMNSNKKIPKKKYKWKIEL